MPVTQLLTDDPTIANRYLANQLTDAERQAFEERLVSDPSALRELEATARFKLGLRKLRETDQLEQLVAGRRWSRPAWLLNAVAAAAILVLGIGLLRLGTEPSRMIAEDLSSLLDSDGNALPLGRTYAVMRKRNTAYDAEIQLPALHGAIELRVIPDQEAAPGPYRVLLRSVADGSKIELARLDTRLMPRDEGYITVFADSALLAPGVYEVALITEGAGADMGQNTFLIRVRSAPDR